MIVSLGLTIIRIVYTGGKALVKLVDREELIRERDEKRRVSRLE